MSERRKLREALTRAISVMIERYPQPEAFYFWKQADREDLRNIVEHFVAEASQRSEPLVAGALWKRADEVIVKLTAHCAGVDLPDEEEHRKAVGIIMDALEGK